jgi:hypothetical protein
MSERTYVLLEHASHGHFSSVGKNELVAPHHTRSTRRIATPPRLVHVVVLEKGLFVVEDGHGGLRDRSCYNTYSSIGDDSEVSMSETFSSSHLLRILFLATLIVQ